MVKIPLTLVVGLIVGALVGPMVSGAIGSAFWSHAADGNDPQEVAARLYTRAQVRLPGDPFWHSIDSPCLAELQKYAASKAAPAGVKELAWTLGRARDDIIFGKYSDLAVRSLQELPDPVLGALDGCISASPLSAVCLRYVADRAYKAVSVPRKTQQTWNDMADRQMIAQWCAAKSISIP